MVNKIYSCTCCGTQVTKLEWDVYQYCSPCNSKISRHANQLLYQQEDGKITWEEVNQKYNEFVKGDCLTWQ